MYFVAQKVLCVSLKTAHTRATKTERGIQDVCARVCRRMCCVLSEHHPLSTHSARQMRPTHTHTHSYVHVGACVFRRMCRMCIKSVVAHTLACTVGPKKHVSTHARTHTPINSHILHALSVVEPAHILGQRTVHTRF